MGAFKKLIVAAVATATLLAAAPAFAEADNSSASVTNFVTASVWLSSWENSLRGIYGLSQLATANCSGSALQQLAFQTAATNAVNDTLAHDPSAPGDLHVCGAGIGGQNVAYATAGPQCSNWLGAMSSILSATPGVGLFGDAAHTQNMLDARWTSMGVGAWCTTSGNLYVTLNFNNGG